jgi:antitoxin ParD1/3/4
MENRIMANNITLSLTDKLRDFVHSRTGEAGPYVTPDEYLRDLIRRDMESQGVVGHVMTGLDDMAQGRFSDRSILDIADKD